MAKGWKEGDRVQIASRAVTEEDRKKSRYFDHMAGLSGTVQNVYAEGEIAVKIDSDCLSDVTRRVHKEATQRMRDKFASNVSEDQKRGLSKEELEFEAHYVLLVDSADLEKVK